MVSDKKLCEGYDFEKENIENAQWKVGIDPLKIRKFFSKVKKLKNGCWKWVGGKNSQGYGCFRYKNKQMLSHRISFSWFVGVIESGMFVCHLCDKKYCVNPHHLFQGTQSDNMQDALSKNIIKSGEESSSSRLSKINVDEIRKEWISGNKTQREISNKFNISQSNVSFIVNNKTWKNRKTIGLIH